jgi:hypothetical protein
MCYFIDEGRLYTFTVYQQPELLIEATAKAAGTIRPGTPNSTILTCQLDTFIQLSWAGSRSGPVL